MSSLLPAQQSRSSQACWFMVTIVQPTLASEHVNPLNISSTATGVLLAALVAASTSQRPSGLNTGTIIRKSIAVDAADWRAEPSYDHCERDSDGDSSRTYDITMLGGTPYQRLVAIDDQPLAPAQQALEDRKREREARARRSESGSQHAERMRTFHRKHERLAAMFQQLDEAFVFTLNGEKEVDGRTAYSFTGKPSLDYHPPTREAQVLTGMTVDFWIDTRAFHWARLSARVTNPVSLAGFIARVEPGTTIDLRKTPIDHGIWLTTYLRIKMASRLFAFFNHNTEHEERSFTFRRSSLGRASQCAEPAW